MEVAQGTAEGTGYAKRAWLRVLQEAVCSTFLYVVMFPTIAVRRWLGAERKNSCLPSVLHIKQNTLKAQLN